MRILVLSDNIFIYEEIKKIFETKSGKHQLTVNYTYSYKGSPLEKHPDFFDKMGVNVKVEYEEIIEQYDLVISAHCKQFFPKALVNNVKCINIHPGYNPINRGWYPQVFAILNQLPIGATIHEMDEKLDHGPIIARAFVEKQQSDTSIDIYNRVVKKELALFDAYFDKIVTLTYDIIVPEKANENLFTKKDFSDLCKLDMNEVGTFQSFYDRLRALTHGEYKNAFFINENKEKVYISINIKKESNATN